MNSFDTKFYSLDTNVIKVDSCTNKLLVFNAETYILLGIKSRKKYGLKNYIYNILIYIEPKIPFASRLPFVYLCKYEDRSGSA